MINSLCTELYLTIPEPKFSGRIALFSEKMRLFGFGVDPADTLSASSERSGAQARKPRQVIDRNNMGTKAG